MPSVAEVPPGGPASTPEVKITSLPPLKPDLFERAWSSTPHPTLPLLATAHGKSVTIFSLASLASHSTLTGGHTRSVRSVSWKPNLPPHQLCLVTGSFDSTAGVWRWDGDLPFSEKEAGASRETEVKAASRPSRADVDSDVDSTDAKDWEFTLVLEGHDSEIKSAVFAPSGAYLATCSRDQTVWIWEDVGATEGDDEWETVAVLNEHEGDMKALAWCPDVPNRNTRSGVYSSDVLASASYDNTVRIWREDGDGEWVCVAVLEGHEGTVWGVQWESRPRTDGAFPRLLTYSADKTIRVWTLRQEEDDVATTNESTTAPSDGTFRGGLGGIPNTMRQSLREDWYCSEVLPTAHTRDIYSATWSASTGLIASTGSDGVIAVFGEGEKAETSHRFRADTPENPPAADNGRQPGKPDGDQPSTSRKQNNAVTEPPVESPIRRVRGSVFSSGRQRPHRARVVDDFPPIKLPQSFLDSNISVFDPAERLRILAADPIWHRGYVGAQWHDWLWHDLEVVLDQASFDESVLRTAQAGLLSGNDLEAVSRRIGVLGETAQWLDQCLGDMWSPAFMRPSSESEFPKDLSIAFLEAKSTSDIVSIILSPERKVDIPRHKLLSKDKRKKVASDDDFLRARIDDHIRRIGSQEEASAENEPPVVTEKLPPSLEEHGSRIYDNKLLGELASAVRAELHLRPDENWVRRELKRPLVVVNIPNYNGTYPSQRLLKRVAAQVDANLIRIDAQDLAALVGGYLGQDSAYYKGSMSMLAYRTAEMNGRLAKGAETSTLSVDDEMSGDIEAAWVNIRQHGSGSAYKSPLEEELQKIKEGAKDYVLPSVDRWENLKINAALDHMVQAAIAKSTEAQQPLIIHVDNYVELTMTLEGALLLGRLRSIVDGLWRDGKRVALVGTSANEDPSEQYVSTLGEIAAEECLITFPLQHQRIPDWQAKKERREAMDFVQENLRNVLAVSRSMNGDFESESEHFSTLLSSLNSAHRLSQTPDGIDIDLSAFPPSFTTSVLSGPDVYHIARLFHGLKLNQPSTKTALQIFLDVIGSHSANIVHASNKADEEKETSSSSRTTTQQKAEPERVQVGGHKYNEFEKKLLTGLVDVKEIRTTFADVHAPPATISALKLLTSLSLVRPEAFAYGVLANDRLPGCLLYGPPGTGKTLLAKAVAKESGASMLEVSGASINDMYVGQSEKNVRALFSLAKKLSPLVIFIDEADALFAARGQSRSRPSHRETINQFLREWDGMSDTKAFIMVATNRPFDLDDAVLRRLPRKILVDLPLQEDRESILRILLKGEQLDASVSIEDIAHRTVLYSGSDLKNLTVAAAMAAVQEELEQAALHTGSEPYVYPERRTLLKRHFDKASGEIAASISEDMDSLKSIRKFDQKYGDQRSRNRKPKTMGFGIMPTPTDAEDARVRPAVPA
ncbi:hypothetical protein VD0002_g5865 [Verticillium dahliae]|uniref:Probable cytosolic iron-sulfur protein assembly protein 1 n=1 Tax=Verticillium dahliae TaxID=27337 RepID=A0AA44WFH4_VERDA|nr:hypothetical protein VdG2_03767 [Verticillium dahliae VDG2]PNH30616.1 hypothetical protein BJF96_g6255 [Verticillium dahliae]PNH62101.1 hypothetical protein VD0002_g5865 [Verticillium dahliae]